MFNNRHWVFQQDSAPAHRAKSTQDWLSAREIDFIRHEDWPSSSPDLSPLDYKIWKFYNVINEINVRLKVYQIVGTSIAVPSSGLLQVAGLVPDHTFLLTAYIGLTAAAVLSLGTLPLSNVIGFLYISEDNKLIKISSVNFWGKRVDKIVSVEDWIPMLELPQRKLDMIYLLPQLSDGKKYKLFIRFGDLLNAKKIGQVLE
ncbi:hypothetical protein evm_010816 [Chilo suppressalis]|nr:hypothetical protein evm_010816 [Chilo suppressalis]